MSPLATVKAFMKLMEPLDYDNALNLIADTCEYTNMPMGSVTGPAGVRCYGSGSGPRPL